MKRTAMKRTAFNSKSELHARSSLKSSKPMRQRSEKMSALYRNERVPLVKRLLAADPNCELYRRIHRVDKAYSDCGRHAIGLHELLKRSAGGSIIDEDNLLRCCSPCNSWVEDNPDLAWSCGLVMRRGETLDDVRKRWRFPQPVDNFVENIDTNPE